MKLETAQCGFFAAITDRHGHNVPILEILHDIKGGKWAKQISHLRTLNSEDYDAAKKKLPAFMVSAATLTGRHSGKDLGTHTGLLQIDIDKLADSQEAEQVKGQIAADPHVLACWISPSGKGVKAIVPIKAAYDTHKACFEAARAHFLESLGYKTDPSCSDASRLCFVGHDSDLILKESAEAFDPIQSIRGEEIHPSLTIHSSPSLQTRSYVLDPPSSILPLHNKGELEREMPCLAPLYNTLVRDRLGTLQPGTRNAALVEVMPFLYSGVHPSIAMMFAARLYEQNEAVFRDPVEQHLKEANALLRGCAENYSAKHLTPEEAAAYASLGDEYEQTAFRICRSLARVLDDDCPPPQFFLSAEKLGFRLCRLTIQADRIMKRFIALGILRLVSKGSQRQKGQTAKASRYEWMVGGDAARAMPRLMPK